MKDKFDPLSLEGESLKLLKRNGLGASMTYSVMEGLGGEDAFAEGWGHERGIPHYMRSLSRMMGKIIDKQFTSMLPYMSEEMKDKVYDAIKVAFDSAKTDPNLPRSIVKHNKIKIGSDKNKAVITRKLTEKLRELWRDSDMITEQTLAKSTEDIVKKALEGHKTERHYVDGRLQRQKGFGIVRSPEAIVLGEKVNAVIKELKRLNAKIDIKTIETNISTRLEHQLGRTSKLHRKTRVSLELLNERFSNDAIKDIAKDIHNPKRLEAVKSALAAYNPRIVSSTHPTARHLRAEQNIKILMDKYLDRQFAHLSKNDKTLSADPALIKDRKEAFFKTMYEDQKFTAGFGQAMKAQRHKTRSGLRIDSKEMDFDRMLQSKHRGKTIGSRVPSLQRTTAEAYKKLKDIAKTTPAAADPKTLEKLRDINNGDEFKDFRKKVAKRVLNGQTLDEITTRSKAYKELDTKHKSAAEAFIKDLIEAKKTLARHTADIQTETLIVVAQKHERKPDKSIPDIVKKLAVAAVAIQEDPITLDNNLKQAKQKYDKLRLTYDHTNAQTHLKSETKYSAASDEALGYFKAQHELAADMKHGKGRTEKLMKVVEMAHGLSNNKIEKVDGHRPVESKSKEWQDIRKLIATDIVNGKTNHEIIKKLEEKKIDGNKLVGAKKYLGAARAQYDQAEHLNATEKVTVKGHSK